MELVGTNVLGYLDIRDMVMLERVCGGKKSHQQFLCWVPYSPAVVLPEIEHKDMLTIHWFAKRQCRISTLTIRLPENPCLLVKNLQVDYFDMKLHSDTTTENLKPLLANNMGYKVRNIDKTGSQNGEVIEQLSACTKNVKQLCISHSGNCMDWLTADILSKWKLTDINMEGEAVTTLLVLLIVQTCSELTSIMLVSNNIYDSTVIAIAQHCPQLEILRSSTVTYLSLLALSERGLPLEELDIPYIPNIPTADIARRCSHALSCIHYLNLNQYTGNVHYVTLVIPYLTGLTSLFLGTISCTYIPLLAQYCHKLTYLGVCFKDLRVEDILPLCSANPLLQWFSYDTKCGITDTTLIELIHSCPHLHTLYLPYETDITDIGILAISEHCPQLFQLDIRQCHNVTEAAVLQLLQCCRKLTRLEVSSSILSKETWTQLDKNIQKRVSRW